MKIINKKFDSIFRRRKGKRIDYKKYSQPLIVLLVLALIFISFMPNFKIPQKMSIPKAKANYQYTANAGQINNSKGTQRYNDYSQTRNADTSQWTVSPIDITGADTSLDMEVTISGVQLQGANKIITSFATYSSDLSLRNVFSIWDATDGVWRPLNNHTAFDPTDPTNLTNFYSQELVPAAINTRYVYQFEIFDGYFANTASSPGTAITTELTHFVSAGNLKLRVSSNDDPGTNNWFFGWDFAQVEVAVDPGYAPSSATQITGGTMSRYYSDLYTSDNAAGNATNTNSLTLPSSGNVADVYFTFNNITTYTGSNTLLLWLTNATSVANLSSDVKVYFWNYDPSVNNWEATAVSSGDASSTANNQNLVWMFSTPISAASTLHVSTGGEAKVKITATHSTSFTLYVDWLKLIVGSTNDGTQQNNVSVGSASGNLSDAGNVDSTAVSPAAWTLTSATTPYPNQYYGDTSATAANYHVAADFSVPITEPVNANITGMHLSSRTNNSSATPVTPVGIRDYSAGWSDFQTRAAGAAYVQHPYTSYGNVYRYPVWGSFGTNSAATTTVDTPFGTSPQDYHDSTNNLAGFKIRTSTGLVSSFTTAIDFAFISIRYVTAEAQLTTQFTPELGTKNIGGAETNNWRFSKANDAQSWTVANSGAGVGVDAELEFQSVVAPTTWNRLIVNTKLAWSTASPTFNIELYDWTGGGTWYPLGGHGQSASDYLLVGSGTLGTQQYYQFEVFDGYFRDAGTSTPGASISTPVTNFIGTGGNLGKVKIKIVRGTTTSDLVLDWAQIELAQDASYYAKSASFNGIGSAQARFYNDTYYTDNAAGTASTNLTYSMQVTKAAAGTERLNTQLNFENVAVPYTGANAILIDTQFAGSQTNPVLSIQLYNHTTATWDTTLNDTTALTQTAGRYYRYQFIKQITTWADYINPSSPNDVRLRFYSENTTAGTFYLDYAKITLGSVTSAGETAGVSWGTDWFNDKTATANLDATTLPSISANMTRGWFVHNVVSNARITDAISSISANINFPVERPAGALVTGVKWAARYQTGATIMTLGVRARDTSGQYAALTNAQYSGWTGGTVANPGLSPAAADSAAVASPAQTYISGLYQVNPEDIVDTANNKINIGLIATTTSVAEQVLVWDMMFVSLRYVGLNTNPTPPTTLKQYKSDDTEIASGTWTNDTSIKYKATVSDPDSNQVKLCVEKKPLATPFTNTEDGCGSLVASGATAEYTISSQTDDTEYHWQARTQDSNGAYSTWTAFGGAPRDYGIDTTAPTGGVVNDAANTGSLTSLTASWSGFDTNVSGLLRYDFAIRRSSDGWYWNAGGATWQVGESWVNNGTNTNPTVNSMNLQSSEKYYFAVKCFDNAGNVETAVNSAGTYITPTLTFSLDSNTINLNNLNASNSWTDASKKTTIHTITNATSGYTNQAFINQPLTATTNPLKTIPNYSSLWSLPTLWSGYGFGYTSTDTDVQGSNRFANGTKYCAFLTATPGDIVADHTDAVNGTTGEANDTYDIKYQVVASPSQDALTYQATITFVTTANF